MYLTFYGKHGYELAGPFRFIANASPRHRRQFVRIAFLNVFLRLAVVFAGVFAGGLLAYFSTGPGGYASLALSILGACAVLICMWLFSAQPPTPIQQAARAAPDNVIRGAVKNTYEQARARARALLAEREMKEKAGG
jgi:hypothetical protein